MLEDTDDVPVEPLRIRRMKDEISKLKEEIALELYNDDGDMGGVSDELLDDYKALEPFARGWRSDEVHVEKEKMEL